ncbi:MAG TPA: stage III sporulation protein AG [Clostridiaceae bacterium]|jgi:stage III sporulation protein AG|nr:stage III sporulation protein AG [Clostridiaceae bacterium]HBF76849.1 stage III sporulation protein AG [Clostridiaceae bacterium]HBG39021.1 stage III sporulation protein AG [Clostridiaceae bacterium]HBN29567.1 stage III sporulation protein AG [Clostridiaceae bacterium]HBX48709.1 stage III sporulation protein AG [Clostridiaceae bacterium]
MKLNDLLEKYLKKNTNKKAMMNLVIVLLIGVLLILIGNITNTLKSDRIKSADKTVVEVASNNVSVNSNSVGYEEKIKKDLTDTLSMIEGVGKVQVMIYFDGGSEFVIAYNVNDSVKKTEEKDNQGGTRIINENVNNHNTVIVNESGGSKPFITKQINPSIGGVIVVAEGAEKPEIKERIQNAVKTVLNIPPHKVSVFPMEKR